MRIVILGDFQFNLSETNITKLAMQDVSNAKPDLVIALGDYGCNEVLGKPQGIEQAYSYLDTIGCEVRPILGNHDLQYETGDNIFPHGTMSDVLCSLFNINNHHGVAEFDQFRIFFISTDPQPAESCYYLQECYLADEHFEELLSNLKERPGVPALFFSHAPPIGSGLTTVPDVHVRATNAFLDQNHNPYRWFELIQRFPEIILWVSAHYHLGHMHPKSITDRFGTFFFMNGVHSNVTRDGDRQSRVIDITPNSIQVQTLDHRQRTIMNTIDWQYEGNIAGLVKQKSKVIKTCCSAHTMNVYHNPQVSLPLMNQDSSIRVVGDFITGGGTVSQDGIIYGSNNRLFAATENGYIWEIDLQYGEALGTLHYNEPPIKGMAITGNLIWRIWENKIAVCDITGPFRFIRERYDKQQNKAYLVLDEYPQCICSKSDASVLIGFNKQLVEAIISHEKIILKEVCNVDNPIIRIVCNSNSIFIRTDKEENFIYDYNDQCMHKINNELFCYTPAKDSKPSFLSLHSLPQVMTSKIEIDKLVGKVSLLDLHNNKMLLFINEQLFYTGSDPYEWEEIPIQGFKAAAICRMFSNNKIDRVCIALNAVEGEQLPRFQIWEIE